LAALCLKNIQLSGIWINYKEKLKELCSRASMFKTDLMENFMKIPKILQYTLSVR
jgi:hypothetical protein